MSKIKEEDYRRYLAKSGDETIIPDNLVCNDHGFASFKVDGDRLVILNCYGDGNYWQKYFEFQVKQKGLKSIFFATRRSSKAFQRKYGYRVIGYILQKEI